MWWLKKELWFLRQLFLGPLFCFYFFFPCLQKDLNCFIKTCQSFVYFKIIGLCVKSVCWLMFVPIQTSAPAHIVLGHTCQDGTTIIKLPILSTGKYRRNPCRHGKQESYPYCLPSHEIQRCFYQQGSGGTLQDVRFYCHLLGPRRHWGISDRLRSTQAWHHHHTSLASSYLERMTCLTALQPFLIPEHI